MNIFLVFDKNQKCTTGVYIYKELKKLNHNVKILYPEEVRSNLSPKPDLILAIDYGAHYIFDVDFHPKAIWLIDTHLTLNCDKIMAEFFDVVFVAQKNNFEKLKNRFSHIYWLPLAGDLDYHGNKMLINISRINTTKRITGDVADSFINLSEAKFSRIIVKIDKKSEYNILKTKT